MTLPEILTKAQAATVETLAETRATIFEGLYDLGALDSDAIPVLKALAKGAGSRVGELEREYKMYRRNRDKAETASAPHRDPASEEREVGQYVVENGCLSRVKQTRDGPVTEALCNFDARITAQEIIDDGAERTLTFEIQGALATGQPLPTITVPAARFGGMNWTMEAWGLGAIVNAGSTNRDHLRAAIQTRSTDAEEPLELCCFSGQSRA